MLALEDISDDELDERPAVLVVEGGEQLQLLIVRLDVHVAAEQHDACACRMRAALSRVCWVRVYRARARVRDPQGRLDAGTGVGVVGSGQGRPQ
eukprot:3097867-Prymnesium_polylepis.1